jgi:hypothetical protein
MLEFLEHMWTERLWLMLTLWYDLFPLSNVVSSFTYISFVREEKYACIMKKKI